MEIALKGLPGEFSGLRLVGYLYVDFEQTAPGTEQGIDLSREYSLAKELKAAPPL